MTAVATKLREARALMSRLHYEVESGGMGGSTETHACCGNDFRRRKRLTEDWREVTCPKCLQLMGIEAAPIEQLTVCEPDPLRRAA
jgi:hypothetical protein